MPINDPNLSLFLNKLLELKTQTMDPKEIQDKVAESVTIVEQELQATFVFPIRRKLLMTIRERLCEIALDFELNIRAGKVPTKEIGSRLYSALTLIRRGIPEREAWDATDALKRVILVFPWFRGHLVKPR